MDPEKGGVPIVIATQPWQLREYCLNSRALMNPSYDNSYSCPAFWTTIGGVTKGNETDDVTLMRDTYANAPTQLDAIPPEKDS